MLVRTLGVAKLVNTNTLEKYNNFINNIKNGPKWKY